ncbi:MAG: MBL fold metallo-hydrolase [Firmicutes bacterium]|nr:MBL fold metallo-hydrolase [Bacillota bacterium]
MEPADNLTIRYLFLNMDPNLKETLSSQVGHQIKAGDAILFTLPNGETLLVDSGMPHTGSMLQQRLVELGVTKLDYVLATHPHWDHIGGFLTVFPKIPVEIFYSSPVIHSESEHYQELEKILQEQQIKVANLIEGDSLQLGGVSFAVLNPPSTQVPAVGESVQLSEINNLSLVLRLDYGQFSMLFTGDIYCEQEELLVEKYGTDQLQVDILDVPHHGRSTSSSQAFIIAVNPKLAIISHEDPNQPREESYRELDIPVFSTAEHGEIVIQTDGKTCCVRTEKKQSPYYL